MKKIISGVFIAIILVLTFTLSAKTLNDKDTSIGTLSNGITYYVKKNEFEKEKASLRLLVNVGSALEEEHERGIAHFLEHMVFRGSKNFKDYEVVKYLESIGAEFGPDTNAFTSFDRTCYMLEVPLKNEKDLEKAFLILSDFAFEAKLDDDKIEIEKNIVLDELRRGLGPSMRLTEKHFDVMMKNTVYQDRMPIGKEEIIKNVKPQVIKDFYKKWYVPKNMAVIAVGDFDKDKIKGYIEKYFSKNITKESNFDYFVNDKNSLEYSFYNDPEIGFSLVDFISIKKTKPIISKKDIKDSIIFDICQSVFNERLYDISKEKDSPFMSAGAYSVPILKNMTYQGITVQLWENNQIEGVKSVLYELKRIKQNKVTQDEFLRVLNSKKSDLEKEKKNLDKIDNRYYFQSFMDTFINKNRYFSINEILDLTSEFLNEITIDDISNGLNDFFNDENYTICVTLPSGKKITESDINQAIAQVNIAVLEKNIQNSFNEEELLKPVFETDSNIVKVIKNEKTNITELKLQNGLTVILKPTDLKKDEIIINGLALMGAANVDSSMIDSAKIASRYFSESGICGISPTSLSKLLKVKNSTFNINLSYNQRSISCNTVNDSFEDMFKLLNRAFTCKNYSTSAFDRTVNLEKEDQKVKNNYPDYIFYEKAENILNNFSLISKPVDLKNVNSKDAENILDTFFSSTKDFTIVIVGDFDCEKAISYSEKYLGSISSEKNPKIKINNLPDIEFSQNEDIEYVKVGKEKKSQAMLCFDLEKNAIKQERDWIKLFLMRYIAKDSLLDALRLKNAKTYGVVNYPIWYFYPDLKHFRYVVSFTGPVDEIEMINKIALDTLTSTIFEGISVEKFENSKKILKVETQDSKKYNERIMQTLTGAYLRRLDPELMLSIDSIIDDITFEEMNDFVKQLFSKQKNKTVIWIPEEKQ
ncbi:MAG: insulinase family protein [Parachlamydiales bacterium]|nr:insulinase family protein [Parachlamydiales bacterium]